jgi:hypothetical protein
LLRSAGVIDNNSLNVLESIIFYLHVFQVAGIIPTKSSYTHFLHLLNFVVINHHKFVFGDFFDFLLVLFFFIKLFLLFPLKTTSPFQEYVLPYEQDRIHQLLPFPVPTNLIGLLISRLIEIAAPPRVSPSILNNNTSKFNIKLLLYLPHLTCHCINKQSFMWLVAFMNT